MSHFKSVPVYYIHILYTYIYIYIYNIIIASCTSCEQVHIVLYYIIIIILINFGRQENHKRIT